MSMLQERLSALEADIRRTRPAKREDASIASLAVDTLRAGGSFTVMRAIKRAGQVYQAGEQLDMTGEQADYVIALCENRQLIPTAALEQAERYSRMVDIYERQIHPLKTALASNRAEHERAVHQRTGLEARLDDALRVERESANEVASLEEQLAEVLASDEVLAVFAVSE